MLLEHRRGPRRPLSASMSSTPWSVPNTRLSADYHVLALDAPDIAARTQPGQFVMVKPGRGVDPLLRRPFSVFQILRDASGHADRHHDPGQAHRRRAPACSTSSSRAIGCACLGPLGRPFTPPRAGGRPGSSPAASASAPFATLAEALPRARPATDAVLRRAARPQTCTTPTGSRPRRRRRSPPPRTAAPAPAASSPCRSNSALRALGADAASSIYACGPTPMMRAVADARRRASATTSRCRSSRRWAAAWAAATAASCRVKQDGRAPHFVRSCLAGPTFRALATSSWEGAGRIDSLKLRSMPRPLPARIGIACTLKNPLIAASGCFGYGVEYADDHRPVDARRGLRQGAVPRRARRARAAAHRRDAGRHDQRDRPAGHRRPPLRRREAARAARARRGRDGQRLRQLDRRVRRDRAHPVGRRGRRRDRAEHLVPEHQGGRHSVRLQPRRHARRGQRRPQGDDAADHPEADAERHRRRVVRARRRGGRRRRGVAGQHVPGDGHRRRDAAAEAHQRAWAA